MNKINTREKYELFIETVQSCGTYLLGRSDADIEYFLFEEFDSDCISYLHESVLKELLEGKYINTDIYNMATELRCKFRALESTDAWNICAVKTDPRWKEIFRLCDKIKQSLT